MVVLEVEIMAEMVLTFLIHTILKDTGTGVLNQKAVMEEIKELLVAVEIHTIAELTHVAAVVAAGGGGGGKDVSSPGGGGSGYIGRVSNGYMDTGVHEGNGSACITFVP